MADIGGQPGNQNAAKGRRWQAAIDRALERRSKADGIAELDRLADKFLDEVEAEGIAGFKEFGDRLDGKPAQTLQGPDGQSLFQGVERIIIDTPATKPE
jgi:hypothetical protein